MKLILKIFNLNYWTVCLLVIIAIHLFIISRLIFFPYPELFIYSYLTNKGLLPYKQIFDQHFPGVMFFPINLATLGIDTPQEAKILHMGLVALNQVMIYITARKLFKNNLYVLVSSFLYLLWQPFFEGNVLWIESFIPFLIIFSFYLLLIKNSRKNYFFSGLLLGLALLMKQVVAPLVFFVFLYLLMSKNNRNRMYIYEKLKYFMSGLLVPIAYLFFWVINKDIWKDFFYWTVTFNLTVFSKMGRKYPDFSQLIKTLPLFGGAIYAIVILRLRNSLQKYSLLIPFFLGAVFFAYARFDFIHLQPALPFAIFLSVLVLKNFNRRYRLAISFFYVLVALILIIPFYKLSFGNEVLFWGSFENRLADSVRLYASENDRIFAFGTSFNLYKLTETLPPGNIFVFQFPWFMKVSEDKVYDAIVMNPPKVVVRDKYAQVEDMVLVEYMPKINDYVKRYYHVVDIIEQTEIMIPN